MADEICDCPLCTTKRLMADFKRREFSEEQIVTSVMMAMSDTFESFNIMSIAMDPGFELDGDEEVEDDATRH